jgi:hypothetical protein
MRGSYAATPHYSSMSEDGLSWRISHAHMSQCLDFAREIKASIFHGLRNLGLIEILD